MKRCFDLSINVICDLPRENIDHRRFFFFSLAGCALIWLKKSSSTMKLYLRTTPEQTQLIIIIIIIIVSFVRFANRNAFLTLNISKREKATQTNVKNCHSQMQ
jgi:hypothetical protein